MQEEIANFLSYVERKYGDFAQFVVIISVVTTVAAITVTLVALLAAVTNGYGLLLIPMVLLGWILYLYKGYKNERTK